MAVVLLLASLAMTAVMTMLNTYQDAFFIQSGLNKDQEEARRCVEAVKADAQETTFNYLFANFWTNQSNPRNGLYSDFGFRQCNNYYCTWIYRASFGYLFPNRYLLAYKWTTGDFLCPICGQGGTANITNDGLVCYSPREKASLGRDFMHLDEMGAASWRSVVFYYVYYDTLAGQMQFRRAQIYLSDIDPSSTKNFGDLLTFPAWEDFQDYNSNGRWDSGEPFTDSNGNGAFDTHQHIYFTQEPNNGPTKPKYSFRFYLHRTSVTGAKETRFEVRQGPGFNTNAQIYVKHPNVNGGVARTYNINCQQTVIGTDVVDVDFSTGACNSVSSSFVDPTSVRMTIAVQSTPYISQTLSRKHQASSTSSRARPLTTVMSTTLHPRN